MAQPLFEPGVMLVQQISNCLGHGSALTMISDVHDILEGTSLTHIVDHGIHPFEDGTQHFGPKNYGVVCIENIPYNVTKAEIDHFLGKNARLITQHVEGCPIHIVMERPTSKTMDCYVELVSHEAAVNAFQRHEDAVSLGKHPRLGQRHVEVVVSNQDELLKALFPRARGLLWENGVPQKVENRDPYSCGFQGFFTQEEMIGMVRHAETPQRSPFSVKCLQRTFECMISTLYKFPWHAQHMYTLKDRFWLFKTYMQQLIILVEKVMEAQTVGLDMRLLMDFIFAGMNCPGFGDRMKHNIISATSGYGAGVQISPLSALWPFDVLSRPRYAPGGEEWSDDVVAFFVYIIELGFGASDNEFVNSQYIRKIPRAPLALSNGQQDVTNIRFEFKEEVFNHSYDEIVSCEMELMQTLIHKGFDEWSENIRKAYHSGEWSMETQRDLDIFAKLQEWDLLKNQPDAQISNAARAVATTQSPPQSPKGTTTTQCGFDNGQDISAQPKNSNSVTPQLSSASKVINPRVDPFEPLEYRMSEPQLGTSGRGFNSSTNSMSMTELPMYTPTPHNRRRRSAIEIRHPDGTLVYNPSMKIPRQDIEVGTVGGHRAGIGRSPVKMKGARCEFNIDRTIEEGNEDEANEDNDGEEDTIMMIRGR